VWEERPCLRLTATRRFVVYYGSARWGTAGATTEQAIELMVLRPMDRFEGSGIVKSEG